MCGCVWIFFGGPEGVLSGRSLKSRFLTQEESWSASLFRQTGLIPGKKVHEQCLTSFVLFPPSVNQQGNLNTNNQKEKGQVGKTEYVLPLKIKKIPRWKNIKIPQQQNLGGVVDTFFFSLGSLRNLGRAFFSWWGRRCLCMRTAACHREETG